MNWIELNSEKELENIKAQSFSKPQLIFKHSTSCSISSVAKNRLEKGFANLDPNIFDFYYLDLLKYRSLSAAIAEFFDVHHESPQVLLIKKGSCIYDESHYAINIDDIEEQALSN